MTHARPLALAAILTAALPAAYAVHVAAQDGFLRWGWPVELAAIAEIAMLAVVVAGVQAGGALVTGLWREYPGAGPRRSTEAGDDAREGAG